MNKKPKRVIGPEPTDRVYCYLSRQERIWIEKNKKKLNMSLSEVVRICIMLQMKNSNDGVMDYVKKVKYYEVGGPESETGDEVQD